MSDIKNRNGKPFESESDIALGRAFAMSFLQKKVVRGYEKAPNHFVETQRPTTVGRIIASALVGLLALAVFLFWMSIPA